MMQTPRNILLIHFYSNGDCLYASVIARQIKLDYPGARLTWAIASNCKNIIAHHPDVDEVIVVPYVHANDRAVMNALKAQTDLSQFDQVFITHPSYPDNTALYDGCIRSNVFRAYPHPITIPVTPILQLTPEEISRAAAFASQYRLADYKQVVLYEFAPLSGQLQITRDDAIAIAELLTAQQDVAVILSSAQQVHHPNPAIVDGSALTLRETAALTHYCTLLLGCSSGITWLSTSTAARQLPMVQVLNPWTTWVNPISRDFRRFGLPLDQVIELTTFTREKVVEVVSAALADFAKARDLYNQEIPLHFKTTRKIVYDLLSYLKFRAIIKHIQVNIATYGWHPDFLKECLLGILTAPWILWQNRSRKWKNK